MSHRKNLGVVFLTAILMSTMVTPVAAAEKEELTPDSARGAVDLALERQGLAVAAENPNVHLPKSATGSLVFESAFGAPTWALSLPTGLDDAPAVAEKSSALFRSSDRTFDVIAQEVNTAKIHRAGADSLFPTSDQALDAVAQEMNMADIRGIDGRILLVIGGPQAPTSYEFNATLPEGASLNLTFGGGVEVVDAAGEAIAFIETPWAIDASGAAVATHFEVQGDTLVQFVDHHGAEYPVVADPSVQSDCGWVTCTIRFDRGATRWIKNHGGSFATLVSFLCVKAVHPIAIAVCGAAVNAIGWAIRTHARNYYNNGNCYGIK